MDTSTKPIEWPIVVTPERIVKMVHAVNSIFPGKLFPSYTWEDLPQYVKEVLLHLVNTVISNPGITSEMVHNEWYTSMEILGWSYGELNEDLKTHPDMVPYYELGEVMKSEIATLITVVDQFKDA